MKNKIAESFAMLSRYVRCAINTYTDFEAMHLRIVAVTNSDSYAFAIMNLCKEIATHFVEPNNETIEECFEIANRFIMFGESLEVVKNKLLKYDKQRADLLFYWDRLPHKVFYGSYTSFVYEQLK